MEMDKPGALAQMNASIDVICERVTRQLALIAEREQQGLSVAEDEAVLREMRVALGLAFVYEAILLADTRHAGMA